MADTLIQLMADAELKIKHATEGCLSNATDWLDKARDDIDAAKAIIKATSRSEIPGNEQLVGDVEEYLHWRKVNPQIKGGENYLKRFRESLISTKREAGWVAVPDEDVEVAIAEAIAVIEPKTNYCEKGVPILADLKKYGWAVMQKQKGAA